MADGRRFEEPQIDSTNSKRTSEESSKNCQQPLNTFDCICLFVSMGTFLIDLTTDIILVAEYWRRGLLYWCVSTMSLILIPSIIINIFSFRWHILDGTLNFPHWITHLGLLGIVHRYIIMLRSLYGGKYSNSPHDSQRLFSRQSDIYMLHLFESFLEAAPQIVLQSHLMIVRNEVTLITGVSAVASVWSMLWASIAYTSGAFTVSRTKVVQITLVLKCCWHCGMLAARIAAIILFSVIFGLWSFVPFGVHWSAMTLWIISQKTNFCTTRLEELLYNAVVGLMYCFCYLNLREGQTRYRLITFYSITISQNLASLLLYLFLSDLTARRQTWAIVAYIFVILGTIIGLSSMLVYYRWFHHKGPIRWKKELDGVDNTEKNNSKLEGAHVKVKNDNSPDGDSQSLNRRSLKCMWTDKVETTNRNNMEMTESSPHVEVDNTDKKLLLEHLIARSGTPTFISVPISLDDSAADVSGVEFHTVENTPVSSCFNTAKVDDTTVKKNTAKIKRSGIFLSPELGGKLSNLDRSFDDIVSGNLSLQKRRGICSSAELKNDLSDLKTNEADKNINYKKKQTSLDVASEVSQDTDSSNKKTSSDSIDLDLDLSFSDINSSDINEFNENIVQKLCLSTLKNIKVGNQDADIQNIQRIALDILKEMYAKKGKFPSDLQNDITSMSRRDLDTPTEALSVHDYENICAVNIAREAWGLRSWGCYSDIENWLHDDSVFRDRRCDTLTSASSEISSYISSDTKNMFPCPPIPARKPHTYCNILVKTDRSRQDSYIDTVVYEMSKCDEETCHGSKMKAFESGNDTEIFIAKPCIVDQCGGVAPPASILEPILEELDDVPDVDNGHKPRLSSESTLVATIDEIRKGTITNSPRNVYHRTENIWDSPHLLSKDSVGYNTGNANLKRALWKDQTDGKNRKECLKYPTRSLEENNLNEANTPDIRKDEPKMLSVTNNLQYSLTNEGDYEKVDVKKKYVNTVCKSVTPKRRQKNVNVKRSQMSTKSSQKIAAANEKDILSQLVSGTGIITRIPKKSNNLSQEDLIQCQINSSLQSLIFNDSTMLPVINTNETKLISKKPSRNKPRRKFSLLRERFEPKLKESDEEILCKSIGNLQSKLHLELGIPIDDQCSDESRLDLREIVNKDSVLKPVSCNVTKSSDVAKSSGTQITLTLEKTDHCQSRFSELNQLKQKRTLFLKQVLSPPKFSGQK